MPEPPRRRYDYVSDAAEIYRRSFATIRAEADLSGLVGQQVAEGILRVREGYFKITPGYDGVWGQLDIFEERETAELMQMRLF